MIREATINDADGIARLSGQLGYPSTSEQIRLRMAESRGVTFVAEFDGAVAGWIHVSLVHSLEADPYPHVYGLVVDEEHRGIGLGRQLVFGAAEWAREQGFERLRLRTNTIRTEAHLFYERLGFGLIKEQKVYELPLHMPTPV